MATKGLWKVVRDRFLRGRALVRQRSLTVQHLGLPDSEVPALQSVLVNVGQQVGVDFELRAHSGDLVLLDAPFAASMSPQLIRSFAEGRPVVIVDGSGDEAERLLTESQRFEHRRRQLLQQIKDIPVVRERSSYWSASGWMAEHLRRDRPVRPSAQPSSFDSDFDSMLDAQQLVAEHLDNARQDVVQQVLLGLLNPSIPPLCASYGPEAHLRFDFRAGLVTLDPLAQQHLRVRRELPVAAPGDDLRCQFEATVREIDETVWDLGIACGRFRLLRQPADWWHAKLVSPSSARIDRYSRIPTHLELARRLRAGPVTPSELRRETKLSIGALRNFLQACLFLQLVRWVAEDDSDGQAAHPSLR